MGADCISSRSLLIFLLCYFFVPPKEALSKDVALEGNNRSPEYKHLFVFFFFFF